MHTWSLDWKRVIIIIIIISSCFALLRPVADDPGLPVALIDSFRQGV